MDAENIIPDTDQVNGKFNSRPDFLEDKGIDTTAQALEAVLGMYARLKRGLVFTALFALCTLWIAVSFLASPEIFGFYKEGDADGKE